MKRIALASPRSCGKRPCGSSQSSLTSAAADPRTRRVLFDLAYVPAPEVDAATVSALVRAMRRIGLERYLFGSDFNVLTPVDEIARSSASV